MNLITTNPVNIIDNLFNQFANLKKFTSIDAGGGYLVLRENSHPAYKGYRRYITYNDIGGDNIIINLDATSDELIVNLVYIDYNGEILTDIEDVLADYEESFELIELLDKAFKDAKIYDLLAL